MKKILRRTMVLTAALTMTIAGVGCGSSNPQDSSSSEAQEPVESVAEISYANVNFDFAEQIAAEREAVKLVPDAVDIPLSVADINGATGVQLAASIDKSNTTDYYLNAMVAGNELVFSAAEGSAIDSANSSASGELEVKDDGTVAVIPAVIKAGKPTDEVITVKMNDGAAYKIHTLHELMPGMEITGEGVAAENAGIYDFALDRFLLRVNTEGELVYYRNMGSVGEHISENFGKQITADGGCYTFFVELHPDYRNVGGGYSSGMYIVMDENYNEIDYVTLRPNGDANHTHGEGYLDEHEFVVLGNKHYLLYSCTPELVSNLPENVTGIDGGNTAYVWAGIMQEVKDGAVLKEISTTDYPLLYESAVEKIDYENSTDQGKEITLNDKTIFALSEGWMDYVHLNSLDYTLKADGEVDKLLVSMRDQCAVYQFDFASGAVEWILGGKASTLGGYDEYATTRTDEKGNEFKALTYAQHYARYTNRQADGTISGNPEISVFDNQTGEAPFLMNLDLPTRTRTFKAVIDNETKTATVSDVIVGADLNGKTDKYHSASHCGSVVYANANSVVIGWGLHAVIDNLGADVPKGTISDTGFDDLRIGSRPVVTEYDAANDTIAFELTGIRNPGSQSQEAFFSYRTYKTAL
ncbi:MAG: aryl-sulfate sulfotransferase [Lachnospiraceae bacterium]|nr:aryl-sulfate sulfotransferase [Lachnospiraceae bacterium]